MLLIILSQIRQILYSCKNHHNIHVPHLFTPNQRDYNYLTCVPSTLDTKRKQQNGKTCYGAFHKRRWPILKLNFVLNNFLAFLKEQKKTFRCDSRFVDDPLVHVTLFEEQSYFQHAGEAIAFGASLAHCLIQLRGRQ